MTLERGHDVTHVLVDLAGGDVVVAGQGHAEISLVISEIEVDFGALTGWLVRVITRGTAGTNQIAGQSTRRAQPGPSSLHQPRHRGRS